MNNSTRQLTRVGSERWLYRTERGDYGPVTTDKIFDGIRERKIDLATQVSVLGTNKWSAAGEFPLFREHYSACKRRWEEEQLHAEAEAVGKRMELKAQTSRGAGIFLAVGVVVALGFGAWVVWRLSKAEPLGLAKVVRALVIEPLPTPVPVARGARAVPLKPEKKVARLSEPESYDTAGIAIGETDDTAHVTQMHFSDDGDGDGGAQGISAEDLSRVVENARRSLHGCATEAAARNSAFAGTEVGFSVAPGGITKVSVGTDARGNAPFIACVKAALGRVSVPSFSGNERRVSVPLRFQR